MTLPTPPSSSYIGTAEQSRQTDEATINQFGIDGFTLMEVAGSSAAKKMKGELHAHQHGVYLCGKGHNAGDALVVARYLIQSGIGATLVFISGTADLSPDTAKNLNLIAKISENDPQAAGLTVLDSWKDFNSNINCDFIVDGMLGTGLDSDLRGEYPKAVEWCNRNPAPVYAIDIPTGLHADNGRVMGTAIKADITYAFGILKQGYYLNDGPNLVGSIEFCELPFPDYLKENRSYLINSSWIKALPRAPLRHKYDSGVLYIIAGSEGLTGAAMLAARSAWAEGLGAVILLCPRGILPVFEMNLPQIIKKPIGNHEEYHFKSSHTEQVKSVISEKKGNVLLGPGLGREDETIAFVHQLLKGLDESVLIDADGLWALSQLPDWEKPEQAEWTLTPHPGELARLTGTEVGDDHNRLDIVKEYSSEKNITLVSKGFPGIVGTPQGKTYLTQYDTRHFARAGFGDVLAGKISAYRSLGHDATHSALLGLLNGKQKLDTLKKSEEEIYPEPNDVI